MYRLYASPGTASLVVHWLLIELGADFELAPVDISTPRDPAYLALNPTGQVPTLIVEGAPVTESAAILMLLAERHPGARLAPEPNDPRRAEYLQWMVYLANALMPAFRRWFYAEVTAAPEHLAAFLTDARVAIEAVWDRVDARLSDGRTYLLGAEISVADYLLTMLTRWSRNMPRPATQWPHLKAYIDRMRARPALIEIHAREGLTDWIAD